jgi:hypothetical protein
MLDLSLTLSHPRSLNGIDADQATKMQVWSSGWSQRRVSQICRPDENAEPAVDGYLQNVPGSVDPPGASVD